MFIRYAQNILKLIIRGNKMDIYPQKQNIDKVFSGTNYYIDKVPYSQIKCRIVR